MSKNSSIATRASKADSGQKIVIIDGHAMAFRAFFALPPESFVNPQGQPTNSVYGFTRMIFNLVKAENPTHIAVAFDLPGKTFRDEIYSAYKQGRKPTAPELKAQFPLIQRTLTALGVAWFTVENYEADDILATIATLAVPAGVEPLLVTSDRDAIQLVSEEITLLQPVKGVTELRRMTPAAVKEKYGVLPAQYPDMAALVGESADNIPGVPKVGEKTAAKWINQYGSLSAIIDHADEIPGKIGENLREHLEQVKINRRMNEAVRTLDLPQDFSAYEIGAGDIVEINAIFDELGFGSTIRKDIPKTLLKTKSVEITNDFVPDQLDVPTFELRAGELNSQLLADFATSAAIYADGTWLKGKANLNFLSLASSSANLVIDPSKLTPEDLAALKMWLLNSVIEKSAVDTKRTEHLLSALDLSVQGFVMDVNLAEFLSRPDHRATDLKGLALKHLHLELESSTAGQLDLGLDTSSQASLARATYSLSQVLEAEIATNGAKVLHDEMELPLAKILAKAEATGIRVDRQIISTLDEEFATRQSEVAQLAYDQLGGEEVNLASPKQLQVVLFERLSMPKTRKIKTGYSTDAESLAELYAKTEHPFLKALLDHREVTKLRQILQTLSNEISAESRIHTTLAQNVAATGRLSSTSPNLQNIPARGEDGRNIRDAFVVSPGFEALLTADYSQIEMRIMAHLSEDEGLIHAFKTGEDLHKYVASQVFSTPIEKVTAQERSRTKAISYGLAYGLSAFGLARQLGIEQGEARALREQYFDRFGGVQRYLRDSVELARSRGYTETLLGRRRYLPELLSDNRRLRENAERVALNSPIQGLAADIIKLAMIRVDRAFKLNQLKSRLLLQVHDELIFEVAEGETELVSKLVQESMEGAFELSVPMDVSIGIGPSWLQAAH